MNVVCGRCSTQYDFDEALVSKRGTTVKCSNCGHQFRVYPPSGSETSTPDQWLIRKANGKRLQFHALRELQRALAQGIVTVADELSRDGKAFRPIHTVPELESFLPKQPPRAPRAERTLIGMPAMARPGTTSSSASRPAVRVRTKGAAPMVGGAAGAPTNTGSRAHAGPAPSAAAEDDDVTQVYSSDQLAALKPPPPLQPPVAAPPPAPHRVRPQRSEVPAPSSVRSPAPPAQARSGGIVADTLEKDTMRPVRPAVSVVDKAKDVVSSAPSLPRFDSVPDVDQTQGTSARVQPAAHGEHSRGEHHGEHTAPKGAASHLEEPHRPGAQPSAASSTSAVPQRSAVPPSNAVPSNAVPSNAVPSNAASSSNAVPPSNAELPRSAGFSRGHDDNSPPGVELSSGAGVMRRGRRNIGQIADAGPVPIPRSQEKADAEEPPLSEAGPSSTFPPSVPPPAPRRTGLRWVFGVLILGGLGLIVATVGRDYLKPFLEPEEQSAAPDARIDSMLSLGHELYRQGDWEGAKEQFDRASALGERHPGVLEGQLLIETTKAEVPWLRLRLLTDEQEKQRQAAETELAERTEKLDSISQLALQANVESPQVNTLLVDSFRIRGQLAAARQRAGELSSHATEPRTAYVLALLDLADEAPGFTTVIERLRIAAGGERSPGRASAALVYALARAGDSEAAKVELEKLRGARRQHELLADLAAFVERHQAMAAASAALEEEEPEPTAAAPRKGGSSPPRTAGAKEPLEVAETARRAGDFGKAERFYQQALQLEPGNVTALAGLGSVARARGNTTAALSHFHAALRVDPSYLRALIAVADLNWGQGNRAEAVRYYKRIGSGNAYSSKAERRIAEFENAAAPAPKDPPKEGSIQPGDSIRPEPSEGESEDKQDNEQEAVKEKAPEAEAPESPTPMPIPKGALPDQRKPPEDVPESAEP